MIKKILPIVLFLLLVTACDQLPGAAPVNQTNNSVVHEPTLNITFLRYKNTLWEYQMTYPRGWTRAEGLWGTSVAFIPQGNESLQVPTNLNVIVKDISFEPTTLQSFTDDSLLLIDRRIPQSFVETQGEVELDSEEAYVLVYTGEQLNQTYKWFQIYSIHRERLYVLTFVTPETHYPKEAPIIQEMVNSFKFID